jgi:hypothetical protein
LGEKIKTEGGEQMVAQQTGVKGRDGTQKKIEKPQGGIPTGVLGVGKVGVPEPSIRIPEGDAALVPNPRAPIPQGVKKLGSVGQDEGSAIEKDMTVEDGPDQGEKGEKPKVIPIHPDPKSAPMLADFFHRPPS